MLTVAPDAFLWALDSLLLVLASHKAPRRPRDTRLGASH
jgi:hypothetical protein